MSVTRWRDRRTASLAFGGNAYCMLTLSRHRASKVSKSSRAQACESNGLPSFAVAAFASAAAETGCGDASFGHSSNDFDSMGLPSYQHFRPSIRRYDHQRPCVFEGVAALHCCLACALGIPTGKSVAIQTAKAIGGSFLICALVAAGGSQRPPNRGGRELPPGCRG